MLNGNFIGTTGRRRRGAGQRRRRRADRRAANDNSLIGCKFVNNPFVYYNVISGNGGNGLHVTDANDITVQGNFFGIGREQQRRSSATGCDGILVDGSSTNTQVGGVIPLGNVSAGNGRNGIEVTGTAQRVHHVQHVRRAARVQGRRTERP